MNDYEKFKVAELRTLLKERNIPSTGLTRKAQFIDKLREADAALQVSVDTNSTPDVAPSSHEAIQPAEGDTQNTFIADSEAATPPAISGANQQAKAEACEAPTEHAQQPLIHPQDEIQPSESLTATLTHNTNDSVAEENKKRKRDEPLGTVDEERNVAKKARAEEEVSNKVNNEQETASITAAEASVVDNAVDSEMKGTKPDDAHSIIWQNKPPKNEQEEQHAREPTKPISADVKVAAGHSKQGPPSRKDLRFESLLKTEPMTDHETLTASMMDEVPTPEKSVHPATRALYIRGFTRPLPPSWLQDHAVAVGTAQGAEVIAKIIELEHQARTVEDEQRAKAIDDELAAKKTELDQASKAIEFVYIDTIRSHAFLLFSSISAAERARAFLHGTVWPKQTWRTAVWVDFIPEDKVHKWVATEKSAGTEVSRWEVVYSKTKDGHVEATLQPAQMQNRKESTLSTRISVCSPSRNITASEQAYQQQQGPGQDKLFVTLDQTFRWTKAKPKLYWRTVPNDAASERSDNLKAYKRTDWDPRNVRMSDEFRRYTFDGTTLVYAGPHSLGPRAREREGLPPIRGGRRGGYRRR